MARIGSDTVSILRSRADGTFDPALVLVHSLDLRDLAVGDLTGDGRDDIFTAGAPSPFAIFAGAGDGTFGRHFGYGDLVGGSGSLELARGVVGATSAQAAACFGGAGVFPYDFDADGRLDLLTTSSCGFAVAYGTSGGFAASGFLPFSKSASMTSDAQCRFADFSSDGNADLACWIADGAFVANGTAVPNLFGAPQYYAPSRTQIAPPLVCDHNGDGFLDTITFQYNAGSQLAVAYNGPNGLANDPAWSLHRFRGFQAGLAGPVNEMLNAPTFAMAARHHITGHKRKLIPVTDAWVLEGNMILARRADGRIGIKTDATKQVTVDLDLLSPHFNLSATTTVMYQRLFDYQRDLVDHDLLPQREGRNVFVATVSYGAISFTLLPGGRKIRVQLNQGGVMQAFTALD